MPRALLAVLLSSVVLLPGRAAADYPAADKRAKVAQWMSEKDVLALLGKPDGYSGEMCPDVLSKEPRSCRLLHYRSEKREFIVELHHYDRGEYVAMRWRDK